MLIKLSLAIADKLNKLAKTIGDVDSIKLSALIELGNLCSAIKANKTDTTLAASINTFTYLYLLGLSTPNFTDSLSTKMKNFTKCSKKIEVGILTSIGNSIFSSFDLAESCLDTLDIFVYNGGSQEQFDGLLQ